MTGQFDHLSSAARVRPADRARTGAWLLVVLTTVLAGLALLRGSG